MEKKNRNIKNESKSKKEHRYYRRLAVLVTDHPYVTIIAIIMVSIFFGINIYNLKIDPDPWKMLPQGDPAVVYWDEMAEIFGNSDAAILAIVSPDTIYNVDTIKKIDELTEYLRAMTVVTSDDLKTLDRLVEETDGEIKELLMEARANGLDKEDLGPISRVLRILGNDPDADEEIIETLADIKIALDPFDDLISLTEVENITVVDRILDTGPVVRVLPETDIELDAIRERVEGNDMLRDKLVSKDRSATIIVAILSFSSHEDRGIAIYDGIKEKTREVGGPEEYYLSGIPMIMSRESKYMSDDMSTLIPAVILLIMLILFIVFRNVRGMITPLLVVIISIIWTMGLMAILGIPISIISTALPVILVAIGCADGIHIITEYYGRLSDGMKKRKALVETMEEISQPVVMTSLTSMAGFGSLITSGLSPIREFGAFTAFGIFAAMVFSLTFIPAMMIILKVPNKMGRAVDRSHKVNLMARSLGVLGRVTISKRIIIFALMIPAFIVIVFMAIRVEVGYGFMQDFKKGSEIAISDNMINEKFPGSINANIIIDSGRPDGAKDPDFLIRVKDLQDYLEAEPLVGSSNSIADFIVRMNYVMHDNDPAYNRLPRPLEEVMVPGGVSAEESHIETINGEYLNAQYLLLYENSGGEDIEKLVDFDYRKVNVAFDLKSSYSRDIVHIQEMAMEYIGENFGNGEEAHLTGTGHMVVVISNYIIKSQIISLATSLVVVFIMLIFVFGSIKAGVYAILPLLFTILSNFTLMRIFDVKLDVATAMIASMGIGIGIDYSIHFVSRYRIELTKGLSVTESLIETINNTGRALILNAIAVAAGFMVLTFSNFVPIIKVGILVSATMIISATATLIIIPALVSIFGLNGTGVGMRKREERP